MTLRLVVDKPGPHVPYLEAFGLMPNLLRLGLSWPLGFSLALAGACLYTQPYRSGTAGCVIGGFWAFPGALECQWWEQG